MSQYGNRTIGTAESLGFDDADGKWVVTCDDHKTVVNVANRAAARTTSTVDFCDACREQEETDEFISELTNPSGEPSDMDEQTTGWTTSPETWTDDEVRDVMGAPEGEYSDDDLAPVVAEFERRGLGGDPSADEPSVGPETEHEALAQQQADEESAEEKPKRGRKPAERQPASEGGRARFDGSSHTWQWESTDDKGRAVLVRTAKRKGEEKVLRRYIEPERLYTPVRG